MPPIFRYSVSAATGYVAEVVYEGTPVFPAVSQKLVRPKYENWKKKTNKMSSASLKCHVYSYKIIYPVFSCHDK